MEEVLTTGLEFMPQVGQMPDYKGSHKPGLREPFKSFKLYNDMIKCALKEISMAVCRMK